LVSAAVPPDHAERMTRGLAAFQSEVRPLLVENCLNCHGGEKTRGGFDLSTREGLLKGGDDGVTVVPFASRESRLLRLVRHAEEPNMPDKKPKLPEAAINRIAAWIDDGAPYDKPLAGSAKQADDRSVIDDAARDWWAFRPLAPAAVVSNGEVVRASAVSNQPPNTAPLKTASLNTDPGTAGATHPIDRFITAKAAAKNLRLSPPADRRTLIRRAYLDLLGLPPPPDAVEAFVRDESPDAWPALIDRLLASPQYGERWARHWLDVARFAESSGFEHDYDREGAFHYRDFVIKALNADMPYDQFLRWQIAGDEFAPGDPLALCATGFLGAGVFPTQITANEVERTRYDALDDMLSTTGSAFLGLTIGCARCHDHKYDPIPSRDYYRMLSTFTTTVRSVIDLDLEPEKTRGLKRKWQGEHDPLVAEVTRHEESLKPEFDTWLDSGAKLSHPATWSLLALDKIDSQAGAKFRKLEDGSWLAEGNNGDHDEYTLTGSTALRRLTGLRLEAMTHPSMKKGGPGRADNGNIGLSRIRVFASPVPGGSSQEVKISGARADFEQDKDHLSISAALDDKDGTGWAVDPQFGKDHAAVFTFAEPLSFTNGVTLTVKLEFQLNTRHNIGRPRLSVTSEAVPPLEGEVLPARIMELLRPSAPAKLAAADRAVVFDWWKRRDAGWRERVARVEEHARKEPDGRTKVLICAEGYTPLRMHTQGADFFNETHFLKRGNTDLKDGVAPQGFLRVLTRGADSGNRWHPQPPEGAKFSGRRRALADWLTDMESGAGPLAARVIVNRLWQHHFGAGIVATPNDFGHTGTPPTHPGLLDWLAGELVRNGWKLKPLHRIIMTSAAYRQSSTPDHAKESADPENLLFVRRIPRRLEGEAIRDCLLAVSGALDPEMFGPGTKDERSHRRSIYFTIKRSQLVGSMVAFDQPEPLVSQGRRPTTTVAPQALMLLNGPQVREWAEAFARRLERDAPAATDPGAAIARAYAFALGRAPDAGELRDAAAFISAQERSYSAEDKPGARTLALSDFCQVIFGLNEFTYEN
jgi:mono/diheme cytochrome c family protein